MNTRVEKADYIVTLRITDAAGNFENVTRNLEVLNLPPIVELMYPNGGEELEGDVDINFNVSDAVDTNFTCNLYYDDNEKGLLQVSIVANISCNLGLNTYTWDTTSLGDSSNVTLYVNAVDGINLTVDESDDVFLVDNTNPIADANINQGVDEGDLVTFNFSADDGINGSGFDDGLNSFFIDFDDGNNLTTDDLSSITHTFVDDGVYTVELTVTDDVGLSQTDSMNVTVSNVAPVIVAQGDVAINEGDTSVFNINFSDVGVDDTHTLIINWGDLSVNGIWTSPTLVSPDSYTHKYEDNGVYNLTINLTDDDGGSHIDVIEVTVNNLAPYVSINTPVDADSLGGVETINWTSYDLGDDDVDMNVYYSDDNGATWNLLESRTELSLVNGTFAYEWNTSSVADGTYQILVNVTDEDGASSFDTVIGLIVDNTAPVTIAPEVTPDPVISGGDATFTATISDANVLAGARVHILIDGSEVTGSPFMMDPADGTFDETSEVVTVVINSSAWSTDTYVFYIEGQDLSGNWEAMTNINSDSFVVEGSSLYYTKQDVEALVEDELDDYYNSSEIDNILDNYYNKTEVYTKSEVDALISGLSATYYTQTQIDAMFTDYYNTTQIDTMFDSVYSKTETDAAISNELSSYYDSSEVDNILSNYYNKTEVYTKSEVDALISGLSATYYTQTQIDTLFSNYYSKTDIDNMFALRVIASSPSGIQSNDSLTMVVQTGVAATCKYSTSAFSYSTAGTVMSGSGSTTHTASFSNLDDETYLYYIMCEDNSNNLMAQYFPLSFRVDTADSFNYVQELNKNWNALWIPFNLATINPEGTNVSAVVGLTSGNHGYDSHWSSVGDNWDVLYHYDDDTSSWLVQYGPAHNNTGTGTLTDMSDDIQFPFWIHMMTSNRFEMD